MKKKKDSITVLFKTQVNLICKTRLLGNTYVVWRLFFFFQQSSICHFHYYHFSRRGWKGMPAPYELWNNTSRTILFTSIITARSRKNCYLDHKTQFENAYFINIVIYFKYDCCNQEEHGKMYHNMSLTNSFPQWHNRKKFYTTSASGC